MPVTSASVSPVLDRCLSAGKTYSSSRPRASFRTSARVRSPWWLWS